MLGRFLDRVKSGEVPSENIVVVEDIDPLCRLNPIDAIEMIIIGLIKRGDAIQTLGRFEMTFDRANMEGPALMFLITLMTLAFQESQKKSERVTAARDKARLNVQNRFTDYDDSCTAWLDVTIDGRILTPQERKVGVERTPGKV